MAKKKQPQGRGRVGARRPMSSKAFMASLQSGLGSPTSQRRRRRRLRKTARSYSYWQSHGPLQFSKVMLLLSDRLLIETLFDDAIVTFEKVPQAELYPRYQNKQWDGMAHFVTFSDRVRAMRFRSVFWSRDI